MTNKWKYNKIQVKPGFSGDQIIHQDSGSIVGRVFPASAEILSDIAVNAAESSDEIDELLNNL